MPSKIVFTVRYSDGRSGWIIDQQGVSGIGPTHGPFSRKSETVSKARTLVKNNRPAKLVVYKMGGEKDSEKVYE